VAKYKSKNKRVTKEIKKASKNSKFLVVVFIYFIIAVLMFAGIFIFGDKLVNALNNKSYLNDINFEDGLKLDVIDVNQGDAIFVELPDGKTMLIDSGDKKESDTKKFKKYIEDTFKGKDKVLDYCILTHPHSDHVGNMDFVFDFFEVKIAYRPFVFSPEVEDVIDGAQTVTTRIYKTYVEKLLSEGCEIKINSAGEKIIGDNYTITFYSPNKTNYSNLNNFSPIIVLEYSGERICLTGDAEKLAESEVTGIIPTCQVLKAGHHGSETASSLEFLNVLKPKYVLVSCGEGNKYNHPHTEFLKRIADAGVEHIFRTDEMGTISMFINDELASRGVIYFYGADNITIEIILISASSTLVILFVSTIVIMNYMSKRKKSKN